MVWVIYNDGLVQRYQNIGVSIYRTSENQEKPTNSLDSAANIIDYISYNMDRLSNELLFSFKVKKRGKMFLRILQDLSTFEISELPLVVQYDASVLEKLISLCDNSEFSLKNRITFLRLLKLNLIPYLNCKSLKENQKNQLLTLLRTLYNFNDNFPDVEER